MTSNVYDFDKTIFSKDSSVEFYKFCLKKKPSILKYIFVQLFYFVLYIFSFIDKTKFKEHVFVFLKSFDNIDDLVKEFWKINKSKIYTWYPKKHQDNDIVISASPYFLLRPICDELGIKNLIASDVDPKTGKFNRPNCYGEEKVKRLNEEFGEVEINEFYSDSFSDQPLADLSKEPFIIKHKVIYKWHKYKPTFMDKVKKHFFTKEFLAFLIVGAINVINGVWLSYVFSLFLEPIPAFFVGYLISLTISYFLNSLLVFKSKLGFNRYVKFCVSYIPNFVIQNGLILIFYYGLHFHKLLVYVLAAIIAIPVTFLVLSLATFGKNEQGEQTESLNLPSICLNTGGLIIMTIAIDILLCAGTYLSRGVMSPVQLPASFVIAAIVHFIFNGRKHRLAFVIEISTVLLVFVGFALLMGQFYDASYDGNSYHKLAIGLLKYGWNPVYEKPEGEVITRILRTNVYVDPWVEGYCKGTWFFAASVYAISGNIETGKCYNAILLVAVLLTAYGAYRKRIKNPYVAFGLAFVTAFNPVLVSQLFTFYIDGALYATLALLIIYLLIWLLDEKFARPYIFTLIGAAMITCGNIKFTGLLLGGCFCILNYAIYVGRTILLNKKDLSKKEIFRKVLPSFITFASIAVLTVVFAGFSAYITNLIRHQTIGYPITGKDAIDIMTPNSPFTPGTNYLVCLFQSLFSKVDNFNYTFGNEVQLKMPFTIVEGELNMLSQFCDTRLSGFGVFFSGVVIISAGLFIYECVIVKKNYENLLLLLNFVLCIIFIFAIKESWWARYAPYAYIAVIMILYVAFKEKKFISPLYLIALACLLVLIVNDCFGLSIIYYNVNYSKELAAAYAVLQNLEVKSIYVYNTTYAGAYFNLMDQGFYIVIDETLLINDASQIIAPIGTYWLKV